MASYEFFTSFYAALSDPSAYVSFQREMNTKAVEQVFFNSLAGKTNFLAVVLGITAGTLQTKSDNLNSLRVRPLDIHDFIIPEPCIFDLPEERKRAVALHPVAFPDSTYKFFGGNEESTNPLGLGHIVECFFGDGPQNSGRMRALNYRPTVVGTSRLNLSCLEGGEIFGEAQNAFSDGGYNPNNETMGDPSKVAEDLRSDEKYSLEPRGVKVMAPKHIVIHYGTSRNGLADQKYGAKRGAGYHYAVSREGKSYYFNDDTKAVYHASNTYFNNNAIAINFVNVGYERQGFPAESDWIQGTNQYSKHSAKWQPYTNEQYNKGAELIAEICKKHGLDPKGKTNGYPTIVGHDYVTVEVSQYHKKNRLKVKSDPGPAFDIENLRKLSKSKM